MMKGVSTSIYKVILAVLFCLFIFLPCSCSTQQMGETAAQGHRRHLRNLRINQQGMMADIDKALLFNQPSRLTDKRLP